MYGVIRHHHHKEVAMKDAGCFQRGWLCGLCAFGLILLGTAGTVQADLSDLGFGKYYEPCEPAVEANAPGYTLPLDLGMIPNWADVDRVIDLDGVSDLLRQNGFAILEPPAGLWTLSGDEIAGPYAFLKNREIPLFVSADTVLHLYHIQFDETLKEIEEQWFIPDMNALTTALLSDALQLYDQLDGDLKEAAKRNVAYFAVAQKLLDPNAVSPALVTESVAGELAKIEAHQGFAPSDIFIYEEDYSQYVPRGHYTQSESLKRYFKTMMWYGRMAFLLKGSDPWGPMAEALISPADARIQTTQALLLAASLRTIQPDSRTGLEIWDRLYAVTAFYVGLADDLTPYDYLWALDEVLGESFSLTDLANTDNYLAIKTALATLPKPKIYGGTGDVMLAPDAPPEAIDEVLEKTAGMRLMGQRFIPDSYMFQHLVFPAANAYTGNATEPPFTMASDGVRGYPRGLDLMALLGSREALHILIDEGDTDYEYYWKQFGELKDEFGALGVTDWNVNLYWSWLYSLRALLEEPAQRVPNFARTAAWQRHQLQSALASWTQLRHDTILYAKQSYTPTRTALPPVPDYPGYIEPVPAFWGRLLALTRMTSVGLSDLGVLSDTADERLANLETLLERMVEITRKQLENEPLSDQDAQYIRNLPTTLESVVIGAKPDGLKTTLVADVHTESLDEMVLEEAVGKVDLIVVACPGASRSVFLAVGPVLSYYEFKHPMSDRLTDEAWRQLLDSPDKPARPAWYGPLMGVTAK
jgi:hypothetical protein